MIIKRRVSRVGMMGLNRNSDAGKGKSRAISRSKRRKRIATRKNRKENGIRADFNGSNPHSYGEDFSEFVFRWGKMCAAAVIKAVISIIIRNTRISLKI